MEAMGLRTIANSFFMGSVQKNNKSDVQGKKKYGKKGDDEDYIMPQGNKGFSSSSEDDDLPCGTRLRMARVAEIPEAIHKRSMGGGAKRPRRGALSSGQSRAYVPNAIVNTSATLLHDRSGPQVQVPTSTPSGTNAIAAFATSGTNLFLNLPPPTQSHLSHPLVNVSRHNLATSSMNTFAPSSDDHPSHLHARDDHPSHLHAHAQSNLSHSPSNVAAPNVSRSSLPLVPTSRPIRDLVDSPSTDTSLNNTNRRETPLTETPPTGISTYRQPFVSTDFPRVVERVFLPGKEDMQINDGTGRIVIRLNEARTRFMGSTEAARFFRKEFGKIGFDYYPKFTKVDDTLKEIWWETFKAKFYWGPHTDDEGREWPGYTDDVMKKAWKSIGSERYCDAMSDAKKLWLQGKKPSWMLDEIFAKSVARWKSDEAKTLSEQNRKNRMSGPYGLVRQSVGSIPMEEHMERLIAAAPPGVIVDNADLFQYTHKKVLPPNAERTLDSGWVDDMSKNTFMEYTSQVASKVPETQRDDAHKFFGSLWRESVKKVGGNVRRKDRLYGCGRIAKITSNIDTSTHSSNGTPFSTEEAIQMLQQPAWQEALKVVMTQLQNSQNGNSESTPHTPFSTGDSTTRNPH